ncbi:MAG: family N-acetyltransferase [Pseudonocardia sp.]|nr:family N-acetyltransferase [Pseudonocardia sp.]
MWARISRASTTRRCGVILGRAARPTSPRSSRSLRMPSAACSTSCSSPELREAGKVRPRSPSETARASAACPKRRSPMLADRPHSHRPPARRRPDRGLTSVAHPLDNPARASLLGPHAHLAQRCGAVLRYPPGVSPFVALPDNPYAVGSISRPGPVTSADQCLPAAGHDRERVVTPALPDLRSASRLAARPHTGFQTHRVARPTPRGRRTPQSQPDAPPGLGRPGSVRRADPAATQGAVRSPPPGRFGHGLALAPPPDAKRWTSRTGPVAHPSMTPSPR